MRIIYTLDEMTETARGWLAAGSVGFVPTMGYLHEGHLTLVQAAKEECEIRVVSIFVNPLQFASPGNLAHYPRNIERDLQLLDDADVDVVFVPGSQDLYPPTFSTYVTPIGPVAKGFEEGRSPGYARGVATSITKLFQIVRPDVAYFGQKDAQRVAIVRQLVQDLNIDVSLRILSTVREHDGLAVSSRNSMLTTPERQAAAGVYQALLVGKALIEQGERRTLLIEQAMAASLASQPLVSLDYVCLCDPDTFASLPEAVPGTLLLIGARIGTTSLIDNILWKRDGRWQL